MNVVIKKKDIDKFFTSLKKKYEIVGPKEREGRCRFEHIESYDDLCLEKQTESSLRKFFLPEGECIFAYNGQKPQEVKVEEPPRIFIMHPCDANALETIEKVYLDEFPDENYRQRRESALLFVFKCSKGTENCFCSSLGTADTNNFDLLFVDAGDKYIVRPGSDEGRGLVSGKLFKPIIRDGRVEVSCPREANELYKLEKHKEDPVWEQEADRCINCNACISVCPTCMCFSLHDQNSVDGKSGERRRHWDYCHMKDFTRVAGGFVFRENKVNRFRHRIYHKLKYFKDQYNKHLCVGCGRCINVCPANIDMLDIIERIGTKNGKRK